MLGRSAVGLALIVLVMTPALAGEPASKRKVEVQPAGTNVFVEYIVPDKSQKPKGQEFIVGDYPKFDVVDTYRSGQGKGAEKWQGSGWDKWSGSAYYGGGEWSDTAIYGYDRRYYSFEPYDFEAYGGWWNWLFPNQAGVFGVPTWVALGTFVLILTLLVGRYWRHFLKQILWAAQSARGQWFDCLKEIKTLRANGESGWPLMQAYALGCVLPVWIFLRHASGLEEGLFLWRR